MKFVLFFYFIECRPFSNRVHGTVRGQHQTNVTNWSVRLLTHLGPNPSTRSLQVVPPFVKYRVRRQLDSGNPILSWSFSSLFCVLACCSLMDCGAE